MPNPQARGEIYIFHYPEYNPDDFPPMHPRPEQDLFVVYSGNGKSNLCIWGEGAFWYRWGETDADWEVVLNVEYWFRIPTTKEIVDGETAENKASHV